VTSIALFEDNLNDSLLCYAHSQGVRLLWGTGYPVAQLSNSTQRKEYVAGLIQMVANTFTDGVNIDIEEPIQAYSPEYTLLTTLVQEVKASFDYYMPGTQVTFDIAWSPDCTDGRCYDWQGLADSTDFLIVMGYDLRSQIFGPCTASANSPVNTIYEGLWDFMTNYGINGSQLVLGVPWYGYDYTCLNHNSSMQTLCNIAEVPFRGVNCSDAAGVQRSYNEIQQILKQNSTTGLMWNADLQSPWFNFEDKEGNIHQVWFDDPQSLATKYVLAKKLGLRGLSMWNADCLYYNGNDPTRKSETAEMWKTMFDFFN